jgi:hypothetical protein
MKRKGEMMNESKEDIIIGLKNDIEDNYISKHKVIEKIRFCIKNNLSMKRLVKELGLK